MKYLSRFDSDGKRITSYPLDNSIDDKKYDELIAEGYIEISEEDWNYYVGNNGAGDNGTGYIKGADGKPTSAPAYVPTKEERLSQLDAQYDADKAELSRYYVEAALSGDTDALADIKAELDELTSKYDKNRAEIEEG